MIDFNNFGHELISSNKFTKSIEVHKGDLTNSGGNLVDFNKKSIVFYEAQLLEFVHSPKLLTLEMKVEYIEGGSIGFFFFKKINSDNWNNIKIGRVFSNWIKRNV